MDLVDPPGTQATTVKNTIAEDNDASADSMENLTAAESTPESDPSPSELLETMAVESLIPELLTAEAIPASTDKKLAAERNVVFSILREAS